MGKCFFNACLLHTVCKKQANTRQRVRNQTPSHHRLAKLWLLLVFFGFSVAKTGEVHFVSCGSDNIRRISVL